MALQSAIVAFDVDRVVGEVRNAADVFLRPRFRSLAAGDVREKSPGEVVTVADEECEARYDLNLWIGHPLASATYLPR